MPKRTNFKPGEIKLDAPYMPHAYDAEKRILGAILLEGQVDADKSLLGLAIARGLTNESFHNPDHRLVFEAMYGMFHEHSQIDEVTVAERLGPEAIKDGTIKFLGDLTDRIDTVKLFDDWLKLVIEKHNLRRIIMSGQAIVEVASQPQQPFEEIVKGIHDPLTDIGAATLPQNSETLTDVVRRVRDRITEAHEGRVLPGTEFRTGLACFDKYLTPFLIGRDYYVCIAAQTSRGKTTLAEQFLQNCLHSSRDSVIALFQLENGNDSAVERLAARFAQVNLQDLKSATPEQMKRFYTYLDRIEAAKDKRIFIFDDSFDIDDIRGRARWIKKQVGKVSMLCVDHLQLAKCRALSSRASPTEVLTEISGQCKQIAKDLRCVGLFLSQLNRESDKGEREPQLFDLRQSGAIEQDADRVLMIGSDGKPDKDSTTMPVRIFQRKLRNGKTGYCDLMFNKSLITFYDDQQQEIPA